MTRASERSRRSAGDGAWRPELLSAFVVISLVAILLTPIGIHRKVHGMRDEIEHAADPARTLVTRVQYLLARQTSSLRGYFITGDAGYLRGFEALRDREAAIYPELARYVDRLDGPVLEPFVELRTLSREWHSRLDAEEIDPRRGGLEPLQDPPFDTPLYLDALAAAARLDEAVVAATRVRRRAIERAERQGQAITMVLALLAVSASLVVAYLSAGHRLVAAEAQARREASEAALREKTEATEARARLLRGVTHDVKNPLGAADAYAALLEEGYRGPLHPDQLEFLGNVRRSIRSALEIIDQLLDLGGAETGALALTWVPSDVGAVARAAAEEHRAAAHRAGHALRIGIDPDLPAILTDPARVHQVLGNLVTNAIRYTPPPGRIEVVATVTREGAPAPGKWIAIRVIDSGPGISREHEHTVFEEFQRLAPGTTPGHGLGLPIARRIARLLNGEVTVGEASTGGAEFVLWLPVESRLMISRRAG